MIISREFLKDFIDLEGISTQELVKTLNSIGLEVDGTWKNKVNDGVVVGFVKECIKHENSDKLHICQVDIGDEILQIVCGAKNVAAGEYVAVALVGAKIGETIIKEAELRGVKSYGMLCSSTELGLAKINDGIMLLDESIGELELGKMLNKYDVFNDEIIEIDITPNRGDCLSLRGVARDLAASFSKNIKTIEIFEDNQQALGIGRVLSLHTDDEINGNFIYKVIEVKDEFKTNLKTKLRLATIEKLGDCAISNLLEYAKHATGVLFCAYDFQKLSDAEKITLDIKKLKNGECGVFFGDKLLSIPGINQSDFAKADKSSKLIILEAHYINPQIIANAHQKYEKKDIYNSFRGSEPVLSVGMDFLCAKISGKDALIYTGTQQYQYENEKIVISFNANEISSCIGAFIEKNNIVKILKSLNFEVSISDELINAKVPLYRHDIKNTQDICEEIVRMIGIDNIPSKPLIFSEMDRENECLNEYKKIKSIRKRAAFAGYFESIHYVMDNQNDLKLFGAKKLKIELLNPITAELNTLRSTLLSHLLKAISNNAKNFKKSIKLFECGSVFDENANEKNHFAMVCSGFYELPNIKNHAKGVMVDFYLFLQDLKNILGDFELKTSEISFLSPFEQALVVKNGEILGFIGRMHEEICEHFDINNVFVCELNTDKIKVEKKTAKPYFNTPSVSRDLSIIAPKNMGFKVIKEQIQVLNIEILKEFHLVDIYSDESLGENASFTINFTFQDSKTLSDESVNAALDEILKRLESSLKIGIRQ